MTDIAVGSYYRHKYGDSPTFRNCRVIRIVEVFPKRIRAKVVTMDNGTRPPKPRFTSMQLKTLWAGYERYPTPITDQVEI